MRILPFAIAFIVANVGAATAQQKCGSVVECAQAAVEAAQASQTATERVRAELDKLKESIAAQEKLNLATRTGFQVLLDNSVKPPLTGKETISVIAETTNVMCENGEYLVGLKLHWTGTCHEQCNQDGPILRTVTSVCRKLLTQAATQAPK